MQMVGVAAPFDPVAEKPADRRAADEGLQASDQVVVRNRDDGDPVGTEEPGERREDRRRVERVLEDLGADDPVEGGRREIELLDLALDEAHVVPREVLSGRVEEDLRDVDGGQVRFGEQTEDVTAAGADLAELEPGARTHQLTDDRQPAALDQPDGEGRTRVVVIDRVLAREPVVQRLDVHVGRCRHRGSHAKSTCTTVCGVFGNPRCSTTRKWRSRSAR